MAKDPGSSPHPVAILLGFSATGKSTLKHEFEALEAEREMDIRDTDVLIGREHGGHVYGVFLDLVVGNNRVAALNEVEAVERRFLKTFTPTKPTLIVAGPALVIRPEWTTFLARVKPRGFYLTIDAAGVFDGLKHRYHDEVKRLGQHPSFGSWNEDMTTDYNSATKRWERVDDTTALANIKRNMATNVALYGAASASMDRYVGGEALWGNAAVTAKVVQEIRQYLGV
jgi:shikimate kinase